MQRTFIVGCPRSGTTFIQALLARHPAILTLPETAFFEHLHGDLKWRWGDQGAKPQRRRLRRRLGFARQHVRNTLASLQRKLDDRKPWRVSRRIEGCARQFVDLLDHRAVATGCSMWVEKTPYHLLYIPEIERQVQGASFIHVIREGEDVLASVADANMCYEDNRAFGGGTMHWSRRWNRAAQVHATYAGQPRHHIVFLEDMIADMPGQWRRLCTFLGIDHATELEAARAQMIADLDSEPWKHGAISGVAQLTQHKAERIFGPQVREWLHEHLQSYDALRSQCRPPPAATSMMTMSDGSRVRSVERLHECE